MCLIQLFARSTLNLREENADRSGVQPSWRVIYVFWKREWNTAFTFFLWWSQTDQIDIWEKYVAKMIILSLPVTCTSFLFRWFINTYMSITIHLKVASEMSELYSKHTMTMIFDPIDKCGYHSQVSFMFGFRKVLRQRKREC